MKYFVSTAISILAAAVLLSCLPIHGEGKLYEDVIRLHILAASDSPEDQALKLQVRDAVLSEIRPLLGTVTDRDTAETVIRENTGRIEEAAATCIAENGYDYDVEIVLCNERYPTREYEDFTLPAGEYCSLQVKINGGNGKNWWCVLFPTVCTRYATEVCEEKYIEAGFTPEQYRLITENRTGKYVIRFKILEILEAVFGWGRGNG